MRDEGTRPEGQAGVKNVSNEPERKGKQSLTRWAGRGSSWQADDLDLRMRSDISIRKAVQ